MTNKTFILTGITNGGVGRGEFNSIEGFYTFIKLKLRSKVHFILCELITFFLNAELFIDSDLSLVKTLFVRFKNFMKTNMTLISKWVHS